MSATVLKFIPIDPFHVPPEAAHSVSIKALERLCPQGHECGIDLYEVLTYIDQGENAVSLKCPICQHIHRPDYHGKPTLFEKIWSDFSDGLERDWENQTYNMTCCGETVKAMNIEWDWPGGFAFFELFIWDPELDRPLHHSKQAQLESILGCKLKQIWAHY